MFTHCGALGVGTNIRVGLLWRTYICHGEVPASAVAQINAGNLQTICFQCGAGYLFPVIQDFLEMFSRRFQAPGINQSDG